MDAMWLYHFLPCNQWGTCTGLNLDGFGEFQSKVEGSWLMLNVWLDDGTWLLEICFACVCYYKFLCAFTLNEPCVSYVDLAMWALCCHD